MFNQYSFEISSAISRTMSLMNQVTIGVQDKVYVNNTTAWARVRDDHPLMKIVNYDVRFPTLRLLPLILKQFMIYGDAYIEKVSTRGHIVNPIGEKTYENKAVAGLTVLDNRAIRFGGTTWVDYSGNTLDYHGERLTTEDYIHIFNPNPVTSESLSLFHIISRHMESPMLYGNISEITHIPHDLIFNYNALDAARKRTLIMRVLEDVVMYQADYFRIAIDKGLGLGDELRLVLEFDSDLDLIRVWETGI